jgi:hypothetical protein
MGFLLDHARASELKRQQRATERQYFEAVNELRFMNSSDGRALHTNEDIARQELLVESLRNRLKQVFNKTM